jgi:cation diffusion facilitator family transporter
MVSEALHSLADTTNQLLIAFGIRRSKKQPDLEHPFGYSKAQFFWSLIVSILIFTLAGTLSLAGGFERILEGTFEVHESFFINYIVLILAIGLESIAFIIAIRETNQIRMEKNYKSFRETLANLNNPALLTVLVEDFLALVGIGIALIATFLTDITDNGFYDALGSIIIGLVLMIGALLLAKENKSYLIGRSISATEQLKIKEIVLTSSGVVAFKSLKSMVLGPDNFILSIDIDFADNLTVDELEKKIDDLEEKIIEHFPKLNRNKIFIEPN